MCFGSFCTNGFLFGSHNSQLDKQMQATVIAKYKVETNRPFPNYLWPLFQSESWWSSFLMKISLHSLANEN